MALGIIACGGSGSGGASVGPASAISIVSGDGQSAYRGNTLPLPVVIRVTDARGSPVPGQVLVTVPEGGGTAGPATTGADGTADVIWRLGNPGGSRCPSGTQSLRVTTVDPASGLAVGPVIASATPLAGPPIVAAMQPVIPPDPPPLSIIVPTRFVASVADPYGCVIPGSPVSFEVTPGSGGVESPVLTDGSGDAATTWSFGTLVGSQSISARAEAGDAVAAHRETTLDDIVAGSYSGSYSGTGTLPQGETTCSGQVAFSVLYRVLRLGLPPDLPVPLERGCFTACWGMGIRRCITGCLVVDEGGAAIGSGTYSQREVAMPYECTGTWSAVRP